MKTKPPSVLPAFVALALVACVTPAPKPPPPRPVDDSTLYPQPGQIVTVYPDGSPEAEASPCGKGCAGLRASGCSEGFDVGGVSCYRACLAMAQHQRVPVACWAAARSPAEVQACGGAVCGTPGSMGR